MIDYLLISASFIILLVLMFARKLHTNLKAPFQVSLGNRVIYTTVKNRDVFMSLYHDYDLPFDDVHVVDGEYGDKEYYKITSHSFKFLGLTIHSKNAMDISEYIHLFDSILDEKKQFEELYNKSYHLIGIISVPGILLRANDTALKAVNTTRGEVIGQYFWETPWWQHSHHEQEKLKIAIKEAGMGRTHKFETTHRTPDGEIMEIECVLKPLKDENDQIIYIVVEGHNITDLKSTERVLRLNQARLMALEDLNFMEWESIAELNITIINTCIQLTMSSYGFYTVLDDEGLCQMTVGYSQFKDQVQSKDIIDEFNEFIEDLNIRMQIVHSRNIHFENNIDYFGNMGLIVTRYIGVPVIVEGKLIGIVWVINKTEDYDEYDIRQLSLLIEEGTKIVERNLMREEMAKANQNLEKKVHERTLELEKSMESLIKTQNQLLKSERIAATGHLIMNVSHQLNTPIGISLTTLSYLSQELEELYEKSLEQGKVDVSDLDELKPPIGLISDSLHNASAWLDKLKLINESRLSGEEKEVNMKEFINQIFERLMMDTKSKDINLSLFIPNDLKLSIDANHYELIFRELIENSLIHGFDKQSLKKIHITCTVIDDQLQIAYDDNGKGMNTEKLNELINQNFSDNEKKRPWGLGLQSLINTVEKYLGGSISLDSEINQGFSCSIQLPQSKKE